MMQVHENKNNLKNAGVVECGSVVAFGRSVYYGGETRVESRMVATHKGKPPYPEFVF